MMDSVPLLCHILPRRTPYKDGMALYRIRDRWATGAEQMHPDRHHVRNRPVREGHRVSTASNRVESVSVPPAPTGTAMSAFKRESRSPPVLAMLWRPKIPYLSEGTKGPS